MKSLQPDPISNMISPFTYWECNLTSTKKPNASRCQHHQALVLLLHESSIHPRLSSIGFMISQISNGFSVVSKTTVHSCKTSLPLDAACLSKVHLKLFALCRRLTMLGWFNDHFMKSAQKVVLLKSHGLVSIFDGAVLNLNAYAPGQSWSVEGDSRWQHYKYVKKDLSQAASKTQIHIACMQFKD